METLRVNRDQRARGGAGLPSVRARSGVVYRRYGDRGYQFQPLASFGRVNAAMDAGERARARRLARALVARAVHTRHALSWEYPFGIYGARARWTSGLTQAVAAQALARVGLLRAARLAFAAIEPRLIIELPQGPWVRLYSFSNVVVLNAQLQALLSLRQYASLSRDVRAERMTDELARTSKVLLPRFDTGWWSRYELRGGPASLAYHRYVTALLWKLSHALHGSVWAHHAGRFRADWRQPPRLVPLAQTRHVYLRATGARSQARLVFRVSKPAELTVHMGDASATAWRPAGRHVLLWRPAVRTPSSVTASISATDYAGNSAHAKLLPVGVRRDTAPPVLRTQLIGNALFWWARDALSPHLRVVLLSPEPRGGIRRTALPHPGGGGVLAVVPPARLVVADGSGNIAQVGVAAYGVQAPSPRAADLPALRPAARERLIWVR